MIWAAKNLESIHHTSVVRFVTYGLKDITEKLVECCRLLLKLYISNSSRYHKYYAYALAHKISLANDVLVQTADARMYRNFNTALTALSAKKENYKIHFSFYSTWDI